LIFLTFSGYDNAGTTLGSRFFLVTLFLEAEDDTGDLVGSEFSPFTSLLGAKTSAME
jgi:hypothetical protein